MAFFFASRRSSFLDMNQRRLRTSLILPLRETALRKRRINCCSDSPFLRSTLTKTFTSCEKYICFQKPESALCGAWIFPNGNRLNRPGNKKIWSFEPNPKKRPSVADERYRNTAAASTFPQLIGESLSPSFSKADFSYTSQDIPIVKIRFRTNCCLYILYHTLCEAKFLLKINRSDKKALPNWKS